MSQLRGLACPCMKERESSIFSRLVLSLYELNPPIAHSRPINVVGCASRSRAKRDGKPAVSALPQSEVRSRCLQIIRVQIAWTNLFEHLSLALSLAQHLFLSAVNPFHNYVIETRLI